MDDQHITGRTGKSEAMRRRIDSEKTKAIAVVGANGSTTIHYPDGIACGPGCISHLSHCERCGRKQAIGKAEVAVPSSLEPVLTGESKLSRIHALAAIGMMAAGFGEPMTPTRTIAREQQRRRPIAAAPLPYNQRNEAKSVKGRDRNRVCPCGSGKKAKKCCGGVRKPERVVPKEMVYEEAGPAPTAEDYNKGSYREFIDEVVRINGGAISAQYKELVASCWGEKTPRECWVAMRQQAGMNTCCRSCHYPADPACRKFHEGANGRCVYCDHEQKCHPGPGATCDIGKGMVAGIDFAYDSELSLAEQEHLREIYRKHGVSRGDDTQISIRQELALTESVIRLLGTGVKALHEMAEASAGAPSSAAEAVELHRWEGEGGTTREASYGEPAVNKLKDEPTSQVKDSICH